MLKKTGERQVASTFGGIRPDHLGRYRHVASVLPPDCRVLDFGCGVGYGSSILASAGHSVVAIDKDKDAIAHALKYFNHPHVEYHASQSTKFDESFDVTVLFEVIEHVHNPLDVLKMLRDSTERLFISTPNELGMPFIPAKFPFHVRHYTKDELYELLAKAKFHVDEIFCQYSKHSEKIYKFIDRNVGKGEPLFLIMDCS